MCQLEPITSGQVPQQRLIFRLETLWRQNSRINSLLFNKMFNCFITIEN